MYLVLIAWLYVAVMMAAAEATAVNGSLLGAAITFVLYGLLPIAIIGYLMDSPRRLRASRSREPASGNDAPASGQTIESKEPPAASFEPDAGGKAAAAPEPGRVAPVREEP